MRIVKIDEVLQDEEVFFTFIDEELYSLHTIDTFEVEAYV